MKNRYFFQPISQCWQHWWQSIAQSIASNESLNIRCAFKGFIGGKNLTALTKKRPWGLAFWVLDPCCNPTGSIWIMESPNRGWIQLKARNRQLPLYIRLLVWQCWQCLCSGAWSAHIAYVPCCSMCFLCLSHNYIRVPQKNIEQIVPETTTIFAPHDSNLRQTRKTSLCCHVLGLDGVVEMSWPGWGASLGWLQTFWQQLEFGNHKHHFYKSVP